MSSRKKPAAAPAPPPPPASLAAAPATVSCPALWFDGPDGEDEFYVAKVPIDALAGCCVVPAREGVEGYQRRADEARADAIAAYLDEGGTIPTNLVLAAQPAAALAYDRKRGRVSYAPAPGALWVIDGQHRLWGHAKAARKRHVPVTFMPALPVGKQAQLFLDINSRQRPVAASLLLDVEALAGREEPHRAELRELFDRLARDKKSPLAGRTSPTCQERGKLSRASFNRAFDLVVRGADWDGIEPETRYVVTRSYLAAVAAAGDVPREALVRATPVAALAEVMIDVLAGVSAKKGDVKFETLRDALRPVGKLWGDVGALRGSRAVLARALRVTLARHAGLKLTTAMVE